MSRWDHDTPHDQVEDEARRDYYHYGDNGRAPLGYDALCDGDDDHRPRVQDLPTNTRATS